MKKAYKLPTPGTYRFALLLLGPSFECDSGNEAEYTLSISDGVADGIDEAEVNEGFTDFEEFADPFGNPLPF